MLLSRRSVCFTVSKSGYDTPSGFGRKAIIADYYKNVKLSFPCNGHAVPVGLPETDRDFAPNRRIHCSLCIKMKTETVKQRQRFAWLCCNHYYKTVTAIFVNRRQSDSQYPDKTVVKLSEHPNSAPKLICSAKGCRRETAVGPADRRETAVGSADLDETEGL